MTDQSSEVAQPLFTIEACPRRAVEEKDRASIIALMFRPISDGLVRDDAPPPGVWDFLSRGAKAD